MKILLSIVLISCFVLAKSQTVEEIIKSHQKALGGIEKWEKMKSLRMVGKLKQNGVEMLFLDQISNGEAKRSELSIDKKTTVKVVKPGSGWIQNGLSGETAIKQLSADEVKREASSIYLMTDLFDYKNRGHKVELMKEEKVEDVFTTKIKLTKKDGGVDYYYLDPKTFLIVKYTTKILSNGKEVDKDIYYSNYQYIAMVRFAQNCTIKIDGNIFEERIGAKMDANIIFKKETFEKP